MPTMMYFIAHEPLKDYPIIINGFYQKKIIQLIEMFEDSDAAN